LARTPAWAGAAAFTRSFSFFDELRVVIIPENRHGSFACGQKTCAARAFMARPARALERHPLGNKVRARPLPGKSPAKPGKSMVKFSVGRRARRSTIKLLARCNHFIVDKEPQHEELPPRLLR
jgi:hypothetical protein